MSKKFCSNIGGQAVLEGVMMQGKSVRATAVRDPEKKIQVESFRFTPLSEKSVFYRLPIIRGILSFGSSMVNGIKTLTRASEVYGDLGDAEPSKLEKWLASKLKIDIVNIVIFVGMVLGIALSVLLFVFLPNLITDGVFKLISLNGIKSEILKDIIRNLTSGAIRIAVFVGYLAVVSLMKDIKRVFMYHGAEHKTISCYEHGLPLTVENVQKMSTIHDRCGTTFMFIVMVISILFFSFFGWQEIWLRILIRLAGIPIVAGISYEILKFLAKFDNKFVRILKAPGLLLQKLSTKQPDDSMVEVAILAFNTVLQMQDDLGIKESRFVTLTNATKVREELNKIAKLTDDEFTLVMTYVTGTKTLSQFQKARITSDHQEKAKEIVQRFQKGMPLQYAVGEVCFYGNDILTDARALIPRPETELLAENVIRLAKGYENPQILELCTGSGAVSVAVAKEIKTKVAASDISKEALSLARQNADKNDVQIEFIESDLFENISGKYDIIFANPPYIPTKDIITLDKSVKDYEPLLALDGGEDGLDFYKRIAKDYKAYLSENGYLLFEIGIGQCDAVCKMFEGKAIEIIKDYNNPAIERILIIKG